MIGQTPDLERDPEPGSKIRPDEGQRLAELHAYQVLDTYPEAAFDSLVQAAAKIAGVPIALVSLIDLDRQWFKANLGMNAIEGERQYAFCDHVVRCGAEMIVPDAAADPRFADNPMVLGDPHICFYAGFPLEAPSGAVLGTLCVIDRTPRDLTEDQLLLLRTLAEQVMSQLQLRREIRERNAELREREKLLTRLAKSESRYRKLVEHSFDVILSHRPDGSLAYVSPALWNVIGIEPVEDDPAQPIADRIHPDDLPALIEAMRAAQEGTDCRITARVQHANGAWRHIETTILPIRDDDGAVIEILSTGRDITARLEAERALAAANVAVAERGRELEEAQMLAGVGSFTYDVASQAITWSPQLKRIFGRPLSFEPNLDSYRDMIHPDDRDVLNGSVDEATRNGSVYEVEHRLLRPDGEERILLARGKVELDADGKPFRLRGTGQDVTEVRRTAAQLLHTGTLFAQVLAATEQSIIATDIDGVITVFNRGAERMLGYTAAELVGVGSPAQLHVPQEIAARAAELGIEPGFGVFLQSALDGQTETREWTYVRKDGSRLPVQLTVTAMHGSNDELTGFIGVASDITEQRAAERDRDEHAMMLRAVIENNQSLIYVKDLEGRYLMVNRAYQEAMGVREADILGQIDDPRSIQARREQANNMRALHGPFHVREQSDLADGRHSFDSVKVPLRDRDGQIHAICGISLDITERLRAEAEVAKAVEAMTAARDSAIAATKAKSAFLATMSHEIRTPMNAVIGMTELLMDTALDPGQRDLLETVRNSGDQLLSIINDILDFSKIESGDLALEHEPFDLRDSVEGTIALFAGTAHGLDLISHLSDDCPTMVLGDVTRLRQVMVNLVGNAVKFTEQGHVLLRVELDPAIGDALDTVIGPIGELAADWDPRVRRRDGRIRLKFTVADSGIGISTDGMGRLFKSFSQVDASTTRVYGGTGLGLAICKAIVEAMDGELTVTSTPGVGSEFTFTVALGRFGDPQPGSRPPTDSLAGKRALIVDDNDTNRRILRLQLESCGMVCTDTETPLAALSLVGGGSGFDLAILDFAMPVMDGVQLAMALRQLPSGRELPLMLLSSIGRRERGDEHLFARVLTKPTRSSALLQAVAEVLGAVHPGPDAEQPAPERADRPAIARPSPEPDRPTGESASSAGNLRILLAEDNEINQKVGRLMLAKLGHQADIVENGSQAVEALRQSRYDIVLMDIHMPVVDGLEATRRIRADLPADRQPWIIAMTASATKEDREACAAAGMDDYVSKPVRADELAAALDAVSVRSG